MGLTKTKISNLIQEFTLRNEDCKNIPFIGININKEFMPSHADTNEIDSSKYKLVSRNDFVFSGMQTGRDNCIRIGMYDRDDLIQVSPAYQTFKVTSNDILPRFLFMYFNSKEKDRYGAFLSDGSIRSNLDWDRFCDIELVLPPIEIQRKYVAIYEGLLANLHSYESKLEELKLVCDGYIEDLRKKYQCEKIEKYIDEDKFLNSNNQINKVLGVNSFGKFEVTKANLVGVDISKYKICKKSHFAYNPSRINLGSIAYNDLYDCIISPMYIVFHVCNNLLNPLYLSLWLKRKEFLRSTLFYANGSVRDTFNFDLMSDVQIPIPPIEIQNSIVEVFNVYNERKEYINRLKNIIKDICPLLVRGAIKESSEV